MPLIFHSSITRLLLFLSNNFADTGADLNILLKSWSSEAKKSLPFHTISIAESAKNSFIDILYSEASKLDIAL